MSPPRFCSFYPESYVMWTKGQIPVYGQTGVGPAHKKKKLVLPYKY